MAPAPPRESIRPTSASAFPGSHSRVPCLPRWITASARKSCGQPGIGGEIGMRRHQCRVVIGRFRVDAVAARRLDQHRDIAGAEAGDREPPAIEPPRAEKRVALGRTPPRDDRLLHRRRQGREERRIFGERECLLGTPQSGSRWSDRRSGAGSAPRNRRECRRPDSRHRPAHAGSRAPRPACRGRRRCRCGRRGSGSWRGSTRRGARPAGVRAAAPNCARDRRQRRHGRRPADSRRDRSRSRGRGRAAP